MAKDKDEEFTAQKSRERFEAALRGARIAGPKPKDSMTPKRTRLKPIAKKRAPKET